LITISGLDAGYGRLQVLFDVSLKAEKRQITAILGPNGSGKSTLLKAIFGQANIFRGSIMFDGVELVGRSPYEIARMGVVYLPQVNNVFSGLTVKENLMISGYMLSDRERGERLKEVLSLFPFLSEFMSRRADSLSGGERQMLSIGMALMRHPSIIMLDEPTANLAPRIVNTVLGVVQRLRDEHGYTVVMAEQSVIKALQLSDHAILMVGGRVVFEGAPSELLNHKQLGRMYLGLTGY